jgi:uncharacterized membrane protein
MAVQTANAPTAASANVGATDDEKLKGALAYVLGFLTGIVVLLIGNDNKFLKFHALQSIIASVAFGIVFYVVEALISSLLWSSWGWENWGTYDMIFTLLNLVFLVYWVYFLYGAFMVYSGKEFKIPFFGDFVEKNLIK